MKSKKEPETAEGLLWRIVTVFGLMVLFQLPLVLLSHSRYQFPGMPYVGIFASIVLALVLTHRIFSKDK